MNNSLVNQIAKRFIQRRDVKAVQLPDGSYAPDVKLHGKYDPVGFNRQHLEDHLSGLHTYGHYLLDSEDQTKLFAFDIDLEKTGAYCPMPNSLKLDPNITNEEFDKQYGPVECNPREIWKDRSAVVARDWYKYQMGMLARKFCKVISDDLALPCAAAYSGSKGIHVYGFTGTMPAIEVREAALLVLDIMNEWEPHRGNNFYKHILDSPSLGYPSFTVEVFPKQNTLDGKSLGNLMRLPLGRNLKSSDPTFFIDLTTPVAELKPHGNPAALLESGDPWK